MRTWTLVHIACVILSAAAQRDTGHSRLIQRSDEDTTTDVVLDHEHTLVRRGPKRKADQQPSTGSAGGQSTRSNKQRTDAGGSGTNSAQPRNVYSLSPRPAPGSAQGGASTAERTNPGQGKSPQAPRNLQASPPQPTMTEAAVSPKSPASAFKRWKDPQAQGANRANQGPLAQQANAVHALANNLQGEAVGQQLAAYLPHLLAPHPVTPYLMVPPEVPQFPIRQPHRSTGHNPPSTYLSTALGYVPQGWPSVPSVIAQSAGPAPMRPPESGVSARNTVSPQQRLLDSGPTTRSQREAGRSSIPQAVRGSQLGLSQLAAHFSPLSVPNDQSHLDAVTLAAYNIFAMSSRQQIEENRRTGRTSQLQSVAGPRLSELGVSPPRRPLSSNLSASQLPRINRGILASHRPLSARPQGTSPEATMLASGSGLARENLPGYAANQAQRNPLREIPSWGALFPLRDEVMPAQGDYARLVAQGRPNQLQPKSSLANTQLDPALLLAQYFPDRGQRTQSLASSQLDSSRLEVERQPGQVQPRLSPASRRPNSSRSKVQIRPEQVQPRISLASTQPGSPQSEAQRRPAQVQPRILLASVPPDSAGSRSQKQPEQAPGSTPAASPEPFTTPRWPEWGMMPRTSRERQSGTAAQASEWNPSSIAFGNSSPFLTSSMPRRVHVVGYTDAPSPSAGGMSAASPHERERERERAAGLPSSGPSASQRKRSLEGY